jgi:hypothetical protein
MLTLQEMGIWARPARGKEVPKLEGIGTSTYSERTPPGSGGYLAVGVRFLPEANGYGHEYPKDGSVNCVTNSFVPQVCLIRKSKNQAADGMRI